MPQRRNRVNQDSFTGGPVLGLVLFFVVLMGLIVLGLIDSNTAMISTLIAGAMAVWTWQDARRGRRLQVQTLGQLLAMTPIQFENAVVELLRELGYQRANRIGGAGDLGADIICRDPEGRTVVVQCKRYGLGASVGSPAIQHFIGMQVVHHRSDRGIFVTTSGYTRAAADLGRRHGLWLIDGTELSRLLLQVNTRHTTPAKAILGEDKRTAAAGQPVRLPQGTSEAALRVSPRDKQGRHRVIADELTKLARRVSDQAFVIFIEETSGKYVQFAGGAHEPLLLDLPTVTLDALEESRAIEYFRKLGVELDKSDPSFPIFQLDLGKDVQRATGMAMEIFERVYRFPPDFRIKVQSN